MSSRERIRGRTGRTSATRVRAAALGVAAALLIPAAVAYACSASAYINLDKASYLPGQSVRISGYQFDPAAATPVTLMWASGSTIAHAPIAKDGTWSLSISLPASMHPGQYLLLAVANGAHGQILAGLPVRAVITVTAPPAPPASKRPARPIVRPIHRARPAPAPHRSVKPRAHAPKPLPAPIARHASPPSPAVAAPAVAAPVAHRATAPVRHARKLARPPAPHVRALPSLPLATNLWSPPPTVRAPAPPAQPALPWVGLALAALGLLALGGAGGAFVALRLRPRPPLDLAEADLADADLAEAELQEIIAGAIVDVERPANGAATNGNGHHHENAEDRVVPTRRSQ